MDNLSDLTPFSVMALVVVMLIQVIRDRRVHGNGISIVDAVKSQSHALNRNTETQLKIVGALEKITGRLEIQDKDHERIVRQLDRIEAKTDTRIGPSNG